MESIVPLYSNMINSSDLSLANILLVDDNAFNLLTLGMLLEDKGIKFETALDGDAAITKIRQQQFSLVFMDCEMPICDGFKVFLVYYLS